MPLIVLTGVPSSGKTTRSLELQTFFENQGKDVHVISEENHILKAGFEKNSYYEDKDKEKHIRGLLKSEVLKLVSNNNIVILDAVNYIKGYRYELYCGTKANRSTQCTLHAEINREEAWKLNENRENEVEKYSKDTFNALVMRYEEPNGNNRWDAPLFTVFPHQDLDFDAIYSCLFKKKPPKPNMSTENPPLKPTNFLYNLDQITKTIIDDLVKEKKNGTHSVVSVPGFEDLNIDISTITIQQLMNSRRQYISYSKMHTPDPENIPKLFVQYLATTFK